MSIPAILRQPHLQTWSLHIDRAPPALWLGLLTAALWPTWHWMALRLADGSDDPLGLLALAALGALAWAVRHELRHTPRLPLLAAAGAGVLAATAWRAHLPPLLGSLMAVLAWAAGLLAFLPDARRGAQPVRHGLLWPAPRRAIAALPVLGLAVLALPLIASLQFYAGYPLRVLTAQASAWLLAPWFEVQRQGASLQVDGLLVIVDAPCSGVQMAWAGYFTACAVALCAGLGNRAFALRLPLVGLAVLAGNVARNTVLVALAATGHGALPGVHEGVGLLALAAVCAAIALGMARPAHARPHPSPIKLSNQ
ncbi:MAG: exosortase Q [Pseudomonadota bacterium]|nr:exosortase Q [Pseudomonadota bacterium]